MVRLIVRLPRGSLSGVCPLISQILPFTDQSTDQIVSEFPLFPRLHALFSTRNNIVPPGVTSGLTPHGRQTIMYQPPPNTEDANAANSTASLPVALSPVAFQSVEPPVAIARAVLGSLPPQQPSFPPLLVDQQPVEMTPDNRRALDQVRQEAINRLLSLGGDVPPQFASLIPISNVAPKPVLPAVDTTPSESMAIPDIDHRQPQSLCLVLLPSRVQLMQLFSRLRRPLYRELPSLLSKVVFSTLLGETKDLSHETCLTINFCSQHMQDMKKNNDARVQVDRMAAWNETLKRFEARRDDIYKRLDRHLMTPERASELLDAIDSEADEMRQAFGITSANV